MRLSQLECFLEVAERLSFTSAAKALYISQPALSKQIALLEEELGARLFIRNSRKVLLTAAGEQFQRDLKVIWKELHAAVRRAGETGRTVRREVRVGCFDGKLYQDFLPLLYRQIRRIDPDIIIRLQMGVFEENKAALDQGAIDIMLTLDKAFQPGPDYRVQRILKRKGVLAFKKGLLPAGRADGLCAADFQGLPLLMVERQSAPVMFDSTMDDLRAVGIGAPEIVEVKNTATLFTSLEMGQGYAVLSEEIIRETPGLESLPLGQPHTETWVLAVWKKECSLAEILMDDFKTDG